MDNTSSMIVSQDTKTQNKPLYGIFSAIPRRYDLVNHIFTWGMDKRWRLTAARECLRSSPKKVLDLCCGTGDLAIHLAQLGHDELKVVGVDYSPPMLAIAAKKAERFASGKDIKFIQADAANLPFPDGYFDSAGISFAFRNLTYKNPLIKRHLSEVLRVLSDKGRFVVLETSQPRNKFIRWLCHLYLRGFVYWIGYLLSGNRGAYHYLAESAARFYSAEELSEILLGAGFRQVTFRRLLFGAVAIHIAIK
jgi:demethylmenaquinone methyltransferase/2-methoxy-6-polyprenyl-1,4-benzoquinol methylase